MTRLLSTFLTVHLPAGWKSNCNNKHWRYTGEKTLSLIVNSLIIQRTLPEHRPEFSFYLSPYRSSFFFFFFSLRSFLLFICSIGANNRCCFILAKRQQEFQLGRNMHAWMNIRAYTNSVPPNAGKLLSFCTLQSSQISLWLADTQIHADWKLVIEENSSGEQSK